MKKFIIALIICIGNFITVNAYASPVIGFGYFENRSENHEYDYLIKIFPNSFAASMEANYDAATIKTGDVESILAARETELKLRYTDKELYTITEMLPIEYFIYGSFQPLPDNNIEITVNIYNKKTRALN